MECVLYVIRRLCLYNTVMQDGNRVTVSTMIGHPLLQYCNIPLFQYISVLKVSYCIKLSDLSHRIKSLRCWDEMEKKSHINSKWSNSMIFFVLVTNTLTLSSWKEYKIYLS